MRTVALRSGLIAAGIILGAAVWLMATPARLGAGWGPQGCGPVLGSMPNTPYMPGTPVYGMPGQPSPQRYAMPPGVPPSQPQASAQLSVPPPPMLVANGLKPKVRAQAPDAPPPAPPQIVLPSPEALGIQVAAPVPAAAAPAVVDWNRIHARIDQLGIVNLRRDRLPQGGYRVVLALSGRQVEGTGTTEAAAMSTALARAEAIVAAGR